MIQFKVLNGWTERQVACRVSLVLGEHPVDCDGDPNSREPQYLPFFHGTKWQLDQANNWWLWKFSADTYAMDCRTAVPNNVMQGIKEYLEWTFSR